MGPFMAIIRPIAAIFTATCTGLIVNALDVKKQSEPEEPGITKQLTPLNVPVTPPGGS